MCCAYRSSFVRFLLFNSLFSMLLMLLQSQEWLWQTSRHPDFRYRLHHLQRQWQVSSGFFQGPEDYIQRYFINMTLSKDLDMLFTIRTFHIAHVFNNSNDRYIHHLCHLYGFCNNHRNQFLRGSYDHNAIDPELSGKLSKEHLLFREAYLQTYNLHYPR